ncbi:MAG: Cys-tRNA(Pro) deacylase [Clostridia bacterium]|nr:Cys-tRNA(Pro) deacylase [Clostridia bacterium]
MRVLDSKKIPYQKHLYADTEAVSGTEVAAVLGQDPNCVFKTLVTQAASKKYYVFLVPVHLELDLKKAAKAAGEKSVSMIPAKELLPLTGYVHGGCSPIGMKKQFATFIHASAQQLSHIFFSAGKIGYQVEVPVSELPKAVRFQFADLATQEAL